MHAGFFFLVSHTKPLEITSNRILIPTNVMTEEIIGSNNSIQYQNLPLLTNSFQMYSESPEN